MSKIVVQIDLPTGRCQKLTFLLWQQLTISTLAFLESGITCFNITTTTRYDGVCFLRTKVQPLKEFEVSSSTATSTSVSSREICSRFVYTSSELYLDSFCLDALPGCDCLDSKQGLFFQGLILPSHTLLENHSASSRLCLHYMT